jgi:hypothetical protein
LVVNSKKPCKDEQAVQAIFDGEGFTVRRTLEKHDGGSPKAPDGAFGLYS